MVLLAPTHWTPGNTNCKIDLTVVACAGSNKSSMLARTGYPRVRLLDGKVELLSQESPEEVLVLSCPVLYTRKWCMRIYYMCAYVCNDVTAEAAQGTFAWQT